MVQRQYRRKNPDSAKASAAKYRAKNSEMLREYNRNWRETNRDKARAKQRRADAKLQLDPTHVLKKRIKTRVRQMLNGNGHSFSALEKILGYSKLDLKRHIERQFSSGMTWDRLMAGEIHIDHIVPISKFNISSVDDPDFRTCWALANLRPLWAKDNQRKQAKVVTFL